MRKYLISKSKYELFYFKSQFNLNNLDNFLEMTKNLKSYKIKKDNSFKI